MGGCCHFREIVPEGREVVDFRLAAFGSMRHESGYCNEERRMTIDRIALFENTKSLWPTIVMVSDNPNATHEIYRAVDRRAKGTPLAG
mgnify:CR=1 FL=1